jgi:Resolvase, N terminal domain
MTGSLVGYARVSTADHNLNLQSDALASAGCKRVMDTASGAVPDRPLVREADDATMRAAVPALPGYLASQSCTCQPCLAARLAQ